MPPVFSKDQKLTIIEYGSNKPDIVLETLKDKITNTVASLLKK